MFELEQAVAGWREQLERAGIKDADRLDELESHLRDAIEQGMSSSADAETAFRAAVEDIGGTVLLANEFGKIELEGRANRLLRLVYWLGTGFVLLVGTGTLAVYDAGVFERALGMTSIALMFLALVYLPGALRRLTCAGRQRIGRLVKTGCLLTQAWAFWEVLQAIHIIHLEIGIVPTMVLWCASASSVLAALGCILVGAFPPGAQSEPPPRSVPVAPSPSSPGPVGFSDGILHAAAGHASRLGHEYIGTEHLLLALLQSAEEGCDRLLDGLNVERQRVRLEIEGAICSRPSSVYPESLPLTPRARRAIRLAREEAQSGLGSEHLFLGLLRERGGVAGKVLRKLGFRVRAVRRVVAAASNLGV